MLHSICSAKLVKTTVSGGAMHKSSGHMSSSKTVFGSAKLGGITVCS